MAEQDSLPLEDEPEEKTTISAEDLAALEARADALETQLQAEKIEKARLEERATKTAAEPAAPARVTYEQLQEWVDSGQITQAQADSEKARQMREDITKEVESKLEQKFTAKEQKSVVQGQFDRYTAAYPSITVEGSEDRRRLQAEYAELLKIGHPNDMRTEVAAMRAVFGSLDRIPETTRGRRETHREAGGASSGHDSGGSGEKWEKGLSADQITAFRHQISVGAYKSVEDPMFQRVVTRARNQRKAS